MKQDISKVIVVGATGNIGKPIVNALLATNQFEVSALTRSSSKSIFPPSVRIVKTNYTYDSLVAAFKGQDAVVCTIATSNLTDQRRMIDAAIEAGVARFIPSEFGFDTDTPKSLEFAPCTIMKIDPVQYLRKQEDKISWTSIVSGLWIDWASTSPVWAWWSLQDHSFVMFDDGKATFSASSVQQVGKAVAAVLLPEHVGETQNTYVYVQSCSINQTELLRTMEDVTGAKYTVASNKAEDISAQGQEIYYRLTKEKSLDELGSVTEFQTSIGLMISGCVFGLGGIADFADKARHWMKKLDLEEEELSVIMRRAMESAA